MSTVEPAGLPRSGAVRAAAAAAALGVAGCFGAAIAFTGTPVEAADAAKATTSE